MITAGLILAALAVLLHVYIFVMESLTWTSPRTRAAVTQGTLPVLGIAVLLIGLLR